MSITKVVPAMTNPTFVNETDGIIATGAVTARSIAQRSADVFNVMDYGAVRDGATDDADAIQAAYDAAAASGAPATVFFPAGYYLKGTVTTITGDYITTSAYGASIDCDGVDGFNLSTADQSYIKFLGAEVYNWLTVGFGIPTDGTANTTLKKHLLVQDCSFSDCVQTNINVRAIQLSCETYGVKILNNHIENIITTSTSTGGNSYGIIVGRKADSLTGGRTGELGSYGYNNSDIHTAEGSTIISGNTIRKMRCSGGLATDAITGILVDGWRCIVSNNVIEDVQYIGAGAFGSSGVGIYSRGREQVITGNSIANCSYACILIKDTSASVTWGDNATTNVTNNVIATLCPLVNSEGYAYSGINNLGNGTNISDNKFVRWKGGIQSSAIFSSPGSVLAHRVRIANNTFDRCGFFYGIRATGNAATITGNQFYYPIGTVSGSMTTINYSAVSAAHSVQIEDNTLHIDTTFTGLGSVPNFVTILCNTFAIIGLKIKNNSARGWLGGGPTVGVWDLISCSIDSATCSDWDISGNSTDALFRGIGAGSEQLRKYTAFTFSGAGVSPTILRKTFDFTTEIILTAASTLTLIEDESGATFANVGAVAAWFYVLPVSLAGMEFGFRKAVAQAMTVDPNGSEIINAGTGGGILTLTNVGSCVYLKCFVAGTWVVTNSNGAYTVA